MKQIVLPSCYAAPVGWYALYQQAEEALIEVHEHFVKQSFRNRCEIYSPNGIQALVVPITHRGRRQTMKDKRISYNDDWRKNHWKSLEAAYRSSPYFEFYEDDFAPLYEKRFEFLHDFNMSIHEIVCDSLSIDKELTITENYTEHLEDFRNISPKTDWDKNITFGTYIQVFESKHGFKPNLSIFDLLFNEGPAAQAYLDHLNV